MMEDWIECELKILSIFELGGDWGKAPDFDKEEFTEAYCIRGSEFRNWHNDKGKTASLRKLKFNSVKKRNLQLNDILVEISGGGPDQPVGRTELIDKKVLNNFKGKNLVCTNFLRLLRPTTRISSPYLNLFLKYFYSTGKIIAYQAGSNNLRNLKFNQFLTINVPLPPLPIQRAIVSKIESLFSSLDSGIADLNKAQEQLKIYRQAVLKKAFEGELTKEWREMNNISTKWQLIELSEISESRLGKMLDKDKNIGILQPYLGNINVRWGKFNLESLKQMRIEDTEHVKYQVVKGDLIICEGGEPGRCSVWQKEEPVFIQKALHRVRFSNNYNPVFFYYYFFYQAKIGGLKEYFTGTTIKHLTGRKLKEFLVPSCSKQEQTQIIKEIESRLSVCDKVEESIKDSLEKAQALRQSILKKAFEGELLTAAEIDQCKQEADYEPASVLLKRIKTENTK
jgi:type I restriction enzyme S subunit